MPSTRPTVDPVLDILEEMGYDFDELEGDGYKRSLKEAIIILTNKDAGDPRIGILIEELKKVKGSRKVEPKEKETTVKGKNVNKAKLLPGRGNFSAEDIKSDVEEKSGEDKKDDIIAFLTSIAEYAGKPARFLHQGLTSSDILDTAFIFIYWLFLFHASAVI